MDIDENKFYEVPECDNRPRYGGPLGEDDDSVSIQNYFQLFFLRYHLRWIWFLTQDWNFHLFIIEEILRNWKFTSFISFSQIYLLPQEAKRKAEEREMKKAEVRKRLEEAGKKKAKKGFLTPERKKKLRVSFMNATFSTAYHKTNWLHDIFGHLSFFSKLKVIVWL